MAKSTIFKSNRSQAVRIPKEVAFPEGVHRVEVIAMGSSRLIVPEDRSWDDFFKNGPTVSEDFLLDRDQGEPEEREPF